MVTKNGGVMIRKFFVLLQMLALVATASMSHAAVAEDDYKEYRPSGSKIELLRIKFDRKQIELSAKKGDQFQIVRFSPDDLEIGGGQVRLGGELLIDQSTVIIDGHAVLLSDISEARVVKSDDHSLITFYSLQGDQRRVERIRQGNRLAPHENVLIDENDFVRGMVLSVTGTVDVYGEVNQDIITLFGDISIAPEAVVRGDIVSLTGDVRVARDATVYGDIFTAGRDRRHRRIRWSAAADEPGFSAQFAYNRVDGARPGITLRFSDRYRMQPSVTLSADYAFESERWRFGIGLEQPLLKSPHMTLGGEYYRKLASQDDWLLSNCENTAFALLATEDFKDYYEADGATVYLNLKPVPHLDIEGRFRHEETGWLKAQPHLFSLFGGDKLFSRNFATVPDGYREIGIAELDSTANASVSLSAQYDNRLPDEPYGRSAVVASASLEWSADAWGSDFDYRRYIIQAMRYQRLHRRAILIGRVILAGSDGYLPMYKRYYLGGLGTLRGYYHKEYMGSRFWMTNFEYRVAFPRTDFALALIWDAARMSNSTKFLDSDEVKHSLGLAAYFGEDFRVSLARRLDRSFDTDPKVYVRLSHPF